MAVEAFALLLSMLALGKLAARWAWLQHRGTRLLHGAILWVCLPASILLHAPRLELGREVLAVAAVPWALLLVSIAAVSFATRTLAMSSAQRTVLLLCVPLGNTSFLGYPLTRSLLGEAAMSTAVVYDQFGSFMMLSTWGLWVLARHGGTRPSARAIATRLFTFPPLVALVVGLTIMPARPPALVTALLRATSWSLLPIAAFAVGLTLSLKLPREELRPLATGLALKLALLPLVALGLGRALALSGVPLQAVVFETAMPPMITAAVLAISAGVARNLASALVGYGTVLSFATLPAWAWLLR